MIQLRVPGTLRYRDLAVRVVGAACKLVGTPEESTGPIRNNAWDNEVVSAFGEAFNNVVIHAYGSGGGDLEIEIEPTEDQLTIRLLDYGKAFDMESVPVPDLDTLPESGLGIFIIKSCMDAVSYTGGSPNVLSMTKYLSHEDL